jgi:GT2 family glycosyltransferase
MEEAPLQEVPPRVSVILVSHNNAPAIRACLEALDRSANRAELEILLTDNGSRDECSRLDEDFPWLHLHRLPRNFGMVKALNIAMRTARGEFFFIMGLPVVVEPDTLARLLAQLEADPAVTAACPLVRSGEGEPVTRIHPLPLPRELFQACPTGSFPAWTPPPLDQPASVDLIHPPVFLLRAYFLKAMRFLDERFGEHWWDLDVCTQIRRAGKSILLLPDVAVRLPERPSTPSAPPARASLAADRFLGAAVWTGKHYGAWHGWTFRLRALAFAFAGFARAIVTFSDISYRLALLGHLLSGQKIDGTQRSI